TRDNPTTPPGGVAVQKVLMGDALSATTAELLAWYAPRWQVGLSFKEMEGELGMCQHKLGPFARVVGWARVSVAAFCSLQGYRRQKQQEAPPAEQGAWRGLAAAGPGERLSG